MKGSVFPVKMTFAHPVWLAMSSLSLGLVVWVSCVNRTFSSQQERFERIPQVDACAVHLLAPGPPLRHFGSGGVDTFPFRIHCSVIVSVILGGVGFHETVERWCGDGGEVPVSRVLDAYIHCPLNSVDAVLISQV